jgi:hypothetical protein
MNEKEFLEKKKEVEVFQKKQLELETKAAELEKERVKLLRLKAGEPLLQMGYNQYQVLKVRFLLLLLF